MSGSSPFRDVQSEEDTVIDARREWLNKKADPITDPDAEKLDGTIGLALSGGGIRSATFNLGVLQAFAEQRLISNLDYLSTVSGGGYIGCWLAAWILRDGDVTNTELLLAPDWDTNNKADRGTRSSNGIEVPSTTTSYDQSYAAEPEPIRHLRASSNYLALRPGAFSIDSWAIATIYVRNVLLNAIVVLPTVVSLVAALFVMIGLYSIVDHRNPPILFWLAVSFFVASALLQQACLVNVLKNDVEPTKDEAIAKQYEKRLRWFFYVGVTFLLLASFGLSLDLSADLSNFDHLLRSCGKRFIVSDKSGQVIILATIFGLLSGIIQFVFVLGFVPLQSLLSVVIRFASGFCSGAVAILFMVAIRQSLTSIKPELAALLAFPLVLLAVFICESARTAIICRVENPETREWTSVFQSYCLQVAAISISLVFLVQVVGQQLLASWNPLSTTAAGAAWGTVAFSSLKLAHGAGFSGLVRARWLDYVILVGPPVFLTGCIVFVASVLNATVGNEIEHEALVCAVSFCLACIAGLIVDINTFSLQEMYQSRLVRAFLGASRPRTDDQRLGSPIRSQGAVRVPNSITQLSADDDIELAVFRFTEQQQGTDARSYTGPLPLINLAVNYCKDVALEYQERKADSFLLSPLYCGASGLGYRKTEPTDRQVWWPCLGTRTYKTNGYGNGIKLGRSMALSGAAVSPSMGYYSSAPVTALLTIFNLRLGAWCGNPKLDKWYRYGPLSGWYHLMKEAVSATASTSQYVYLSDGGHFDNLGVYELLRRRVKYIFASDAGADPIGACNELGMVLRKATVDFGIRLEIDTSDLEIDEQTGQSTSCVSVGEIVYPACGNLPESKGYLIYMKMTMTGGEPVEVTTYKKLHKEFPHQSTIHQFYSESQFESYRRLGLSVGRKVLIDNPDFYEDGHPRMIPKRPRNLAQLRTFLEIVVANNRWKETDDWESNALSFNKRYAELVSRLLGDLRLVALREQVELISKIISLSERNWYESDSQKLDWQSDRVKLEEELRSLFGQRRTPEEDCAEQAWMAEAITLLDDVITDLNLHAYDCNRTRGWMRVIRIWMNTHAFEKLWSTIEPQFLVARKKFVKELWRDKRWITSPLAEKL